MAHGFSFMLYDYLDGTLSAEDRLSIESHLEHCPKCARDLAELRESVSLLDSARAASRRTTGEPEWDSMVESIIAATAVMDRFGAGRRASLATRFGPWLAARHRPMAIGTAVAVAALLLVVFLQPGEHRPGGPARVDAEQMADSLVNERVTRYLHTSRMLLTGLANGSPADVSDGLAPERGVSRELLTEARYLRRQPLDGYSAEVISEIERIMLTMANLPDQDPAGGLLMIQQGVDHRNLLFRVRMAEQAYRSRTNMRASAARQGDTP